MKMIYRNPNTGDTITLVQRQSSKLWEMRNSLGEWIGAADYLPILQKKMERNWYELIDGSDSSNTWVRIGGKGYE